MTVRLTVRYGDDVVVDEFENHDAAYWTLTHPHVKTPDLVVIQELDAPVKSTWGEVKAGDEVLAPDGSLWRCVDELDAGRVAVQSLDQTRELIFNVTPDMPIMRRPGVLSAATQLLHDVGLWSGR